MNNEQQNHTNPKVSIIVPVYNVEKYIKKCASSLFEQTYPNIEYIFVNDASTDNSLDTLKHIAKNNLHQHITIVENKHNSGSSATRNNAINIATGEYITFCDSDDWVEPTAIEEMVNTMISHNADIVVTPFYTNTFNQEKILNFEDADIANLNKIPLNFLYFSLC